MGKTGKWLRNLLTGKKDHKEKEQSKNHPISIPQPTTPKEKRRWSFRRSSTTAPGTTPPEAVAVIQLTADAAEKTSADEEAAAIKIQSVFRGYLSRKALKALKGLVKLQALVRGHLVRKQATATLRCMQALVSVQARARAQRLLMAAEETNQINQRQFNHRKSTQDNKFMHSNQDYDRGLEENIKIVEMDLGHYNPVTKSRNSYSSRTHVDKTEITDFDEHSFNTAQSSPQCYSRTISKHDSEKLPFSYPRSEYAESLYNDYTFCPNYMSNTESSRAKARSHSAPKQRPVESTYERQLSNKRRPSLEGRNVPRAVRMQRSSSHVGSTVKGYKYPWSVKLDKSMVSLKDSECGSTSTMLTNSIYCRSLVGFEVHGARY
ncbi:hypothetical protein ACJIZ3_013841 [Penstemon smallii]|uniref:DUF4005 domain-containing protein n=1 Tax=Penstemon smallii TaxID=265156 RepID=A0ABD3RI66_9LAMI